MADIFRSQRLVYRAMEDNDADVEFLLSLNLDSEGRINGNDSLFKPVNMRHAQEQANRFREFFLFVIICLSTSSESREQKGSADAALKTLKPIGRIGLWKVEENYRHHRNATVGIHIASEHQRKGYGSEAIAWVLSWAFEMAGLHRVGITCFSYNPGARTLYERLGFVFEGRKRESVWYYGRWHDEIFLGMLEREWRFRNENEKSESGSSIIPTGGWAEKLPIADNFSYFLADEDEDEDAGLEEGTHDDAM